MSYAVFILSEFIARITVAFLEREAAHAAIVKDVGQLRNGVVTR